MTVPKKSFKVAGGFVTVPVACPAAAKGACEGAVSLRYRGYRIAGGEFFIDPGDRDPVLMALTKRGRTYTKNGKTIKAALFVSAKDAAGIKGRVKKTVTIVGQKPATTKK